MTTLTKEVTLNPGQSQQVGFQVTPQQVGIYSVSVDGLTGSFVATEAPVFDPWQYDTDNSCYIEFIEWMKAAQDYGNGIITEAQYNQVVELYQYGFRNPACVIDYSGNKAWCAYRFYHELPGRNVTTWVVTETEGRIGNLSVELTKAGLAGVEATFRITTGEETFEKNEWIALEVLGWWQYGKFITGVTIYDYNYTPTRAITRKIDANPGEMLHYMVYVIPGGALTKIWNAGGDLIFEYLYECDAKRIITFQTELEYWRYYESVGGEYIIREGKFRFAGEVTLESLYREGVGWLNPADVCSFYGPVTNGVVGICDPKILLSYDHYKEGGSWIFRGRVDDEV